MRKRAKTKEVNHCGAAITQFSTARSNGGLGPIRADMAGKPCTKMIFQRHKGMGLCNQIGFGGN
jgi:hypothetical protein